jgi:hypothetical protein
VDFLNFAPRHAMTLNERISGKSKKLFYGNLWGEKLGMRVPLRAASFQRALLF